MNIVNSSKTRKFVISKYNVFAEKLLKKKGKPLWDQRKRYTKAERDAALSWLARALKVDMGTRTMLQFVLKFKRVQEKRLRGYLLQCIRQKIPSELTLYMKIPGWIKDVEAKMQMLPRLIETCRISGELQESRTQEVWANIMQLLLAESHKHQRVPTLEDVQTVAALVGVTNYQLLFRLWTRQKDSAIYKLRALEEAGDVARDVALALTQLEWKVLDVVLLYMQDFPLVFLHNKIQPYVTLYQLVIAYKIDENNNVDQKEKWAKVVQEYSRKSPIQAGSSSAYQPKYVTSPSGVILQRRWWELKRQVHDNIRERLRTEGYKVHPLLVEIAAKYPHIVRESQEAWHDMVKNGRVYDVSDVQIDVDTSDDDDSDEDDTSGDNVACNSTTGDVINLDSDFDSEDDRPLIINEIITKKNTSKSMPDMNTEDKETPEQNTVPQDSDNVPATPKKDEFHYLIAMDNNINSSIVEHKINSEINMLNNELYSQLNCLNSNESNSEKITMESNVTCSRDNIITYNDSKSTDNIIETDGSTPKDNVMTTHYTISNDNLTDSNDGHPINNTITINDSIPSNNSTESSDSLSEVKLIETNTSNPTDNITTTDYDSAKYNTVTTTNNVPNDADSRDSNDSLITMNVTNPAGHTIKTYSKIKPVIDRTADSVKVIESELQKLELKFQKQMRIMMTAGGTEANADKRKQSTKKVGDKIVHDSDSLNTGTAKGNKTYSSIREVNKSLPIKKKGVTKQTNKETKGNSASTKIKTTDTTKICSDKLNKTNATNMTINEGNMAPKNLLKNIDTNTKTTTEIPNDKVESIIATVYTCKGPDGRDLGHVILPAPISKDAVTVSLKTNNGSLSIESAVVNDIQDTLNEPVEPSNKIVEPLNESKESDLDLLQKIDPAQATTMILFSDSEEESENVPINNINQESMLNIKDKTQESIPKVNDINQKNVSNTAVQKEDYINLNDVKKYLSNHSLDDILSKMGDMVVKKEVKKAENENLICLSDSEDDDTRNNEELGNNNDISMDNDNAEVTDTQNANPDQVFGMLGSRSNECTMVNNINSIAAMEAIVKSEDVLNMPNADVLIIPPNFFHSTPDVLIPSVDRNTTPNILIPPKVESSPRLVSPMGRSEPLNVLFPTSMISRPTTNVVPTSKTLNPTPLRNLQVPPLMEPSRTPDVTTSNVESPTLTPTPAVESSTLNIKIPTPNSNVVTMIINEKIEKEFYKQKREIAGFQNLFDDVMSVDGDLTINKNTNSKSYQNKSLKSLNKKPRRIKTYSDRLGYSGLFKLKDRSTQETVGMLCRIKEEKSLVKEVTEKIDNYLEKCKDNQNNSEKRNDLENNKDNQNNSEKQSEKRNDLENNKDNQNNSEKQSEKRSEFYNIINKKLGIESQSNSNDGFLKMMLENCQAETLWTGGGKKKSNEKKCNEESNVETVDPKLLMDTRVYLPKLDDIESYNKNRRVDFSINTKRINKLGYKVLNHKMKSDDPALIADNTEPNPSVAIAEHIETEIAVALRNKMPIEASKKNGSEENGPEKLRKGPIPVDKPKSKQNNLKLLNLRAERLEKLMKQIKKEREIQKFIDPDRTREHGAKNVTERIDSLTTKIIYERQKQQLVNVSTTNMVQRIQFEADEGFNSNIDTSIATKVLGNNEKNTNFLESNDISEEQKDSNLQSVLQETAKATKHNDKEFNDDFNGDDIYDNEDMELDTINDNTLLLDSSNALMNIQEKGTCENDTKISVNNRKKHRNRIISSDEEDDLGSHKKSRKVRKRIIISDDEDDEERYSKSDEELGLRIESELLKKESVRELLQTENDMLKEMRSSDDVPVGKSNIEEMLKLCKPFSLCLERVQVPKDADSQVRKVELPDRSSLKRHRAPTAHVAPINVRACQSDSDNEGPPEVTAEGDATEAEIGNLLQQLTKETAYEWNRLEESVKPKRPRVSHPDHCERKERRNESEQSNDKKTDRNKRKEDEKKSRPQKDSDDEIDANLEWQRQKNINYKFFNFNPINNTMNPGPNNTRRDKKKPNSNKKLDLLVKKVVVDDNRMHQSEIIDLDDIDEESNDKISEKETHAAIKSIISDIDNIVECNKNTNEETIQVMPKEIKLLKVVPKEIKLTPIFTKIEPKFVKTDEGLRPRATEQSNELIPIATKVELYKKDPEDEEYRMPSIIKKYYTTKFKNFVQLLPKKQNDSHTSTYSQPSTSKDSNIPSKDPIPSTSKVSSYPDCICISDESNDIFELTHTISVKNNDSNASNKEKSAQSVSLRDLLRENNINNNKVPSTINRAPEPIIRISPATKIKSSKDNLNSDNEHLTYPNSQILNPPVKVYGTINLKNKKVNPAVKIMEIGPINSDASGLELVANETSLDDYNGTDNCPKITNVTSIPSAIDLDCNASSDGFKKDENTETDSNKQKQIKTEESTPQIENVLSVQSIGPYKNSHNSVEEKSQRGLGLEITNVRSIPTYIDSDYDNKLGSCDPPNSNDEHYDSDSDNLQIDESSNQIDEENLVKPSTSTSKDLGISSTNLKTYDNVSNPKAKNKAIPFKNTDHGKTNKNTEVAKYGWYSILKQNVGTAISTTNNMNSDSIDSSVPESDSSNVKIGEVLNNERVTTEPSIFEDSVNSSQSIKIHSEHNKQLSDDVNEPTISNSEETSETNTEYESNTIDDKKEVSKTDISCKIEENLDNTNIGYDNSKSNDDKMDVDKTDITKIEEKDSLTLHSEERLLESSIPNSEQDNSTNYAQESDSTNEKDGLKTNDHIENDANNKQDNSQTNKIIENDSINEQDVSKTNASIENSQENYSNNEQDNSDLTERNLESEEPSKDSKPNVENEPIPEKPKTFIKVVPIQTLRGEPLVTKDTTDDITKDIKLRGRAMPFQCLSDNESTKSAFSDEENVCVDSCMPVISNVVSLSSLKEEAPNDMPSGIQMPPLATFPIKVNKADVNSPTKVWNPSGMALAAVSVLERLNIEEVSSNPPMAIADYIKDRDCTNISLLCIDEWRPLWMFQEKYLVLTNLKLPVIGPTYWTMGPRSQCTRLVMDEKSSGSTVVGELSVPDEVFLDNNWYKKLSTDPMIYAKIWSVVPDAVTCREMLKCNVQMHLLSRETGTLLPLVVLKQKPASKPAQYRINSCNLESLQLPALATLVSTNHQTLEVNGNLMLKDMFPKPVTNPVASDEVISLDSDDE